jgi:hypothetical protein
MLTNLSTLLADGDLQQVAAGEVAVVLVSKSWRKDRDGMTPEQHVLDAMKVLISLANTVLETAVGMNSCSKLQGRHGLHEIRKKGVRFYGARLGPVATADGERVAIVFAGAEQKSGRTPPDEDLLDRVERSLGGLRDRYWNAKVVDLQRHRQAKKSRKPEKR